MARRPSKARRLYPDETKKLMAVYADMRRRCREEQMLVHRGCSLDHAFEAVIAAIDALDVFISRSTGDPLGVQIDMSGKGGPDIRDPARRARPGLIEEPGMFLGELRAFNERMWSAIGHARYDEVTNNMFDMVGAAEGALVTLLAGRSGYFRALGTYATEGQKEVEEKKLAKERGEIPWRA